MENALSLDVGGTLARWRELAWPREHGSWSLALEPLALGLIAAPSAGGAWLALAVAAGFFARRPLRTAVTDARPDRRAAARGPLAVLAVIALGSLAAAVAAGGAAWLTWLIPVMITGAVFLFFDLRGDGREELAEVAGVATFAGVPAMLAALAGWGVAPALALAAGVAFVQAALAPRAIVALLAVLAVRATVLLGWTGPTLRARTLGMIEATLGAGFVVAAAIAWRAA